MTQQELEQIKQAIKDASDEEALNQAIWNYGDFTYAKSICDAERAELLYQHSQIWRQEVLHRLANRQRMCAEVKP